MNYYRECIKLTLEIALAIYIIIFGYAVWDNFDKTTYYIAETNNNTREVQVYMEPNILILHNVSKKTNNTKLILKVDKYELDKMEQGYMILNDIKYNLKALTYTRNDKYYFFEMQNIIFDKHETINYNYSIKLNEKDLLDYEFIIQII